MFLFGLIDNGLLLLALALGVEFERFIPLPKRLHSQAAGAVIGAVVGNALSDGLAGLPQGWGPALSVTAGCLSVLVGLPLVLNRIAKRQVATAA